MVDLQLYTTLEGGRSLLLHIKGKGFSKYMYKEINLLTNHSKIKIKNVDFIKEGGIVEIIIERYSFVKTRELLGIIELDAVYDYEKKIESKIVISNVVDYKTEHNCKNIDEITVLFGLTVEENIIELYSAEEEINIPCFHIEITVSNIDILIEDLV